MSLYNSNDDLKELSKGNFFEWPSFSELFATIRNHPIFTVLFSIIIFWWPLVIGGPLFLEFSQEHIKHQIHLLIQLLSYLFYVGVATLFFIQKKSSKFTDWLLFPLLGIPVFHLACWNTSFFDVAPDIFWSILQGTASPALYITSLLQSEKYSFHRVANHLLHVSTFLLELIFLWILILFSPRKNSTHPSTGRIGAISPAYFIALLSVLFIGTVSYPAYIKIYAP